MNIPRRNTYNRLASGRTCFIPSFKFYLSIYRDVIVLTITSPPLALHRSPSPNNTQECLQVSLCDCYVTIFPFSCLILTILIRMILSAGSIALKIITNWGTSTEVLRSMDTVNSGVQPHKPAMQYSSLGSWLTGALPLVFSAVIITVLFLGWRNRENSYLSPADGLGYAMGITGGLMMLLLLLYPLRKSWRFMQGWGSIKYWFQFHMLFGILGPVLVLFHANFSLGSTNSNLALYSMLIVAGSGVIGRYLYSKIHFGLYGQKATLKELRETLQISKGNLGENFTLSPRIISLFKKLENSSLRQPPFLLQLLFLPYTVMSSFIVLQRIKSAISHDLKKQARKNRWSNDMLDGFKKQAKLHVNNYYYCLKKTSQLSLYSKLFSAWHILHLPLFFMLVITGVIHVIAVHMY